MAHALWREFVPRVSQTDFSFPSLSVVAVHGLNPRNKSLQDHAWDTWRKPSGQQGHLWLRDYLPSDIPNARIFLYEYDSSVLGSNKESFADAGNSLLEWLRIARLQVRRPSRSGVKALLLKLTSIERTPSDRSYLYAIV